MLSVLSARRTDASSILNAIKKESLALFYRAVSLTKSEIADICFTHEKAIVFELSYFDSIKKLDEFKARAVSNFEANYAHSTEKEIEKKAHLLMTHFKTHRKNDNQKNDIYTVFAKQFEQSHHEYTKIKATLQVFLNEQPDAKNNFNTAAISPSKFLLYFYQIFQDITLNSQQKTTVFLILCKMYFGLLHASFHKAQINYHRILVVEKKKKYIASSTEITQTTPQKIEAEIGEFQEAVSLIFNQFNPLSLTHSFIRGIKAYWVNLLKIIYIKFGFHSKEWHIAVNCLRYIVRSIDINYLQENHAAWQHDFNKLKSDIDTLCIAAKINKEPTEKILSSLSNLHIQIRIKSIENKLNNQVQPLQKTA